MQDLYGKSGMRKAPSILIPWLVWGLQFAKYSACARLYQCSRIVLGCSLHLCGFAQNKKNRGLRQGEQSRVTGILRTSLHPMPKSARTNAELAFMQNQPPCAIANMIRNDTKTLVTGCCEIACCRQANFFLAESTAFFALHGVSSGDLANSSSSAPFCNARHLTSLL